MKRRTFLAALPAACLAGCGFELRRVNALPFASLYVEAAPDSAVAQRVRTLLKGSQATRLTETAGEAEAILRLGTEARSKTILSLSGAGRVTEYRLGLRLGYSVAGRDGRALAAPENIELVRDMTYDDSQLLAKGAEEQLLYRDMEDNAAQRIVRRLQAIGPGNGR